MPEIPPFEKGGISFVRLLTTQTPFTSVYAISRRFSFSTVSD